MKPRRTLPKKLEKVIRNRHQLKKPLTRAEVQKRVLRMVKNLGLDSRRNEWRLARWFLAFATAPDLKRLRRFKEEAEFVASTKAGIALVSTKGGILFKPNIPDQDLSYVKTEVWKAINWALDEKARVRGMSTAPLTGIPAEVLFYRVGNRLEKNIIPMNFTGRLLLCLFDVLSRAKLLFARCTTCQGLFVRRGRQLYCSLRCAERVRAAEARRTYLREYMRKRRATMKRLEDKAPGLAERVRGGEITLNEARARMRKKAG